MGVIRRSASSDRSRYALIGAGAVARSLLTRIPGLVRELGPVASSSVRVAGRISNSLHGGHPVGDLSAFDAASVILICAPDTGLHRIVGLLERAPLDWPRKTILFIESGASSLEFPQFYAAGASVGSLNPIEGINRSYVVEGSRSAMREAKRIVKQLGGFSLDVEFGSMSAFNAARTLSSSLFTPLIDSCVECLQNAGVDRGPAAQFAEALFARTLRSYMHAGRRGWSGPIAANDRAAIVRQYEAIKKVNVLRAEYFRQSAEFAFELYQTFPELTRYLPKS
jgi:predicted short-subunit dehydrogenase-like oxidoreductase (DUF2520 family)